MSRKKHSIRFPILSEITGIHWAFWNVSPVGKGDHCIHNRQKVEETQVSIEGWINKMYYINTMKYYSALKGKDILTQASYTVDEPWGHYASQVSQLQDKYRDSTHRRYFYVLSLVMGIQPPNGEVQLACRLMRHTHTVLSGHSSQPGRSLPTARHTEDVVYGQESSQPITGPQPRLDQ